MRGSLLSCLASMASACTLLSICTSVHARPACTSSCSSSNCTGSNGTICCKPVGPDVIVGDLVGVSNSNAETISGVMYDSFSVGTTSCNVGDRNLLWNAFPSVSHPAIHQSLFRLKDGRLEQVGISWLKHGFTALTENICGCVCNGSGGSNLGVGCSDPYSASRNGTQSSLKPRYYVNAHTGVFPSSQPTAGVSGTTTRRLRVRMSDLEPTSASVRYFVEAQYVAQDDAWFNNADNNCSYREMLITGTSSNYTGSLGGSTQREKPGIRAWKANDPAVVETDIQIPEAAPTSPGFTCSPSPCPASNNNSSLMILAAKATQINKTTWHYEYALQNVNSDSSAGSFSIPMNDGVVVTNIGFRGAEYHGGDGIGNVNADATPWATTRSSSMLTFSTAQGFAQNPNGNAIRWGTMYNLRFDANTPPQNGTVNVGLFKVAGSVNAQSIVPTPVVVQACSGDIVPPGGNGAVDVNDLLAVIGSWGPCSGCPADFVPAGGNGVVDVNDLLGVIAAWGACP